VTGDGYSGPALLTVGQTRFEVRVELRGHFEPIDGRYHWYGRIDRHDELSQLLSGGRTAGILRTSEGASGCELADPDLWGRYRVTGTSTPPYRVR